LARFVPGRHSESHATETETETKTAERRTRRFARARAPERAPPTAPPGGDQVLDALLPPADAGPQPSRLGGPRRAELIFDLVRVVSDAVAVLAAFALAYELRVEVQGAPLSRPFSLADCLAHAVLLTPFLLLIFALAGLYTLRSVDRLLYELRKVFLAVSSALLFLVVVDFTSDVPLFASRTITVYAYVLALGTVGGARWAIRSWRASRGASAPRRCPATSSLASSTRRPARRPVTAECRSRRRSRGWSSGSAAWP
jgi:hypothetical protein